MCQAFAGEQAFLLALSKRSPDLSINDKPTYNQIRQYLMNELGISREFIRNEVRELVQETVRKYLANVESIEEIIDKAVRATIEQRLTSNHFENWGHVSLKSVLRKLLTERAEQLVDDMVITIEMDKSNEAPSQHVSPDAEKMEVPPS